MWPRTGEVIYEQTIPSSAMQELATFCQEHQLVVELYDRTGYFVEHQHELITMHGKTLQVYPVKRTFEPRFCDFSVLFEEVEHVWIKAVIICDLPEKKKVIEDFARTHTDILRFSPAKGPNKDHHHITFFNITHPSVNKGLAAAMVARELGVSKAETMAIGDANNDESLFEAADTRVAMGNATQALKDLATHIVADADNDGAAWAILNIAMER